MEKKKGRRGGTNGQPGRSAWAGCARVKFGDFTPKTPVFRQDRELRFEPVDFLCGLPWSRQNFLPLRAALSSSLFRPSVFSVFVTGSFFGPRGAPSGPLALGLGLFDPRDFSLPGEPGHWVIRLMVPLLSIFLSELTTNTSAQFEDCQAADLFERDGHFFYR